MSLSCTGIKYLVLFGIHSDLLFIQVSLLVHSRFDGVGCCVLGMSLTRRAPPCSKPSTSVCLQPPTGVVRISLRERRDCSNASTSVTVDCDDGLSEQHFHSGSISPSYSDDGLSARRVRSSSIFPYCCISLPPSALSKLFLFV